MNASIPIPVTTLVTHLSASSLSTYGRCPREFFFRYIAKKKPSHRPVALPFGSAWGTTVAWFLMESRGKSPATTQALRGIFDEQFEREIGESDAPVTFAKHQTVQSLQATAHKMVEAFVQKVQPPAEVLGIEKAFSLYLQHPDDPDESLPVPIVGAMDAVVVQDGKPVIWEVKSAAKRYSGAQLATMLQPSVYVAGARIFGWEDLPVDVLVTTKTAKPDVQVERLRKGRRDELELYDLADHVLKAVGAGAYPRNRGWGCSGCGYREACDR